MNCTEVRMSDPFDPRAVVIARANAADRAAEELTQERQQRAVKRLGRRTLSKDPRQITEALTGRGHARDMREYAQLWYEALRTWNTREVKISGSFQYDDSPPPDLLLIGSNRPMPTVYLQTPAGEFDEANVGLLITEMARHGTVETRQLGKMLHKLRHTPENCLENLLREDGRWNRNRESATRYAVAVLTLAVQLRVQEAETPLRHMQKELAALRGC